MKKILLSFFLLFSVQLCIAVTIISPNASIKAKFELKNGLPFYSVTYSGFKILEPSELGLILKDPFSGGFKIDSIGRTKNNSEWKPIWGEQSIVPDRYSSVKIKMKENDARGRFLILEIRAYDEGIAFRYCLPFAEGNPWQIEKEATEFRFPDGSAAFAIKGTEDTFPKDPILMADLPQFAMAPLTVRLPKAKYASVLEAFVVNYPRCMIEQRAKGSVGVALKGKASGNGSFNTPWRVILIGSNEAGLIENRHIIPTLNPAMALSDPSWIKPGLTISDQNNCPLQMASLKKVIDVASVHGFKYLQLDWGWYGTEWPWTDNERKGFKEINPSWMNDTAWIVNTYANPYKVANGRVPYRPNRKDQQTTVDLNIPELVKYARERNMGICLYVHGKVLENSDLDKLFATYQSWGIVGLKPGFVSYGSSKQTDWIRSLVSTAAKYKLWLCIHDAYVPEGMDRSYPNLFVNEGGGGQEGNHPVQQDVILPFTRCLAGPFDYTPLICAKNKSNAHGLAFLIVYHGPTTVVRGSIKELESKGPKRIGDEAEFISRVPMNWDESRVIDASIGDHIITARRSVHTWFIGGMTGDTSYKAPVNLNFLEKGKSYTATIFRDSETETDGFRPAIKEIRQVKRGDNLNINMARAGGLAVVIDQL